ncbi:MAG: heme lyase CcmF/NrfE family subunit [Anaerolineales bacterium]|nr:heme lyase CcmF/NrfE family subunit [Anaerolineales bacterium]
MLANLGYGALIIALMVCIYGIGAALYGVIREKNVWVNSARNAMLLTAPLITLSVVAIVILLIDGNYELDYVASVTSNSMPLYLKITALWGGQAGSLVFWSWLMSLFASAVTLRRWDRDREFLPWVIIIVLVTLTFFLCLNIFLENPFARLWQMSGGLIVKSMLPPSGAMLYMQSDGNGLNPLLRHFGMIFHPPMLYLGFVSFVIPFAFALAALITGRTDDRWIRITRRWTLVAWLFLSLGLVLGSRWAYDVLGWGGYWGWDAVEISALMPWLSGTAFLHSIIIQEKRNMLKQWNMALIILTYDLVIFATFLTRSGVLSSVHAFAQSAIGPLFFAFIALTFLVSIALLMHRWNDLKSDSHMTSLFSREALFLLNNLLFMGILVVCFWGVIFPLLSEVFTGQKVTVGPPYYKAASGPLFAGLLLLMGVAPLAAWGRSTYKTLGRAIWKPAIFAIIGIGWAIVEGVKNPWALLGFGLCALVTGVIVEEFWRGARARQRTKGENFVLALWRLAGRNRRRYGGYIIHLGVVFMALGIIGIELFQTNTQATIAQGEQITLDGYVLKYEKLSIFDTEDRRNIARAVVHVYKDGRFVQELYPRRDFYYESQQQMTIPGVRSTWEDDLYIILVEWEPVSAESATFKVFRNPLINWLWFGAIIFMLGALAAALPEKEGIVQIRQVKHSEYSTAKV